MKKKLNVLSKATISGLVLAAALSSTAFAETDAYQVKDSKSICSYDSVKLADSFLDSKMGKPSPLYNDFKANLTANNFYAFHDNKNGFLDYAAISEAFMANRNNFKLNAYTETSTSKVTLSNYKTISPIIDGKIAYTDTANTPVNTPKEKLSATFTATTASFVGTGQQLVHVGTVNLNATEKDCQVTGLSITRKGLSSDFYVSGVTVWDGDTKLNLPAIFSNGVADITFETPLKITKGGSKDLKIKVNISEKAQIGGYINFCLEDVSSIKSNTQVSGIFPATSEQFAIDHTNFLGGLIGSIPNDAPNGYSIINVGDTDVNLSKFTFSATNKDEKIKSITLTQSQDFSDNDLKNLKLYKDGVQVGSTVSNLTNKKAVFTFDTPIDIKSNSAITFEFKGDITGCSGEYVKFDIENQVISSGTAIASTNKLTGNFVPIKGTLILPTTPVDKILITRSKDTSSPISSSILQSEKQRCFAAIKFETIEESIQLRKIYVYRDITGNLHGKLSNIQITANGEVLASQSQASFDGNGLLELSLLNPAYLRPGKPLVLKIIADHSNLDLNTKISLGIKGIEGASLISGKNINDCSTSSIPVMGNQMTVGK